MEAGGKKTVSEGNAATIWVDVGLLVGLSTEFNPHRSGLETDCLEDQPQPARDTGDQNPANKCHA